jgi:hypothetical protein
MRYTLKFAFVMGAACWYAQGQDAQSKDQGNAAAAATSNDMRGLPPRAAPSDYQAQAKAGSVTIAAEFKGHSIPTLEGILTTEDFVVVEVGMFGAADARLTLSLNDFTLRINGKKTPAPSEAVVSIARSVKDPEWEPVSTDAKGSKTKLNTGGGGGGKDDPPPPPPKMPLELQRAMIQKVQKSAVPQGDRPLPQAGLLFFEYGSQAKNVKTLELIYSGPAGKATLALAP